mmetsp:Transcript_42672/g.123330  ORF Transcript_42672/g.123330 Transcript_42672/m.123330 type:complete len:433 (-) Transcript_42672:20-1318(-)
MVSNCAASLSLGCFFCCQGCNAEKLRNAFAFLPPAPSYTIQDGVDGKHSGDMQLCDELLNDSNFYSEAVSHASAHFVNTSRGEVVPIVWVWPPTSSSSRWHSAPTDSPLSGNSTAKAWPLVLLHCHGNATDIGLMMGPYFELSSCLGVEVVGVEYSGYGTATGSPSTTNAIADVEAAYEFVVESGVPPERIVAYGQSVGSGPAMHLAARRRLGGVILHSPMISGIKVLDPQPDRCCRPSCVYSCFDFFDNYRNMRGVGCPAFVMHGLVDDIVPAYHGTRLAHAAPAHRRWPGFFPEDAGHNDIVETNTEAYFGVLRAFLRHVQELADSTPADVGKLPFPNIVGKPEQQEMSERRPGGIAWPTAPPCDEYTSGATVSAATVGVGVTRPYREPAAGPCDGRYVTLRGGRSAGRPPQSVASGAGSGRQQGELSSA